MHVLGLPPAFVLSQDQTLKLKSCCQLILDVRTSAHRPGVQPGQFLSVCASGLLRNRKSIQTVKLTLHHRAETLRARYAGIDPSNEPNRPHISSDTINFKERRDKSDWMRPNFSARPASITSGFFLRLVAVWPGWRPVASLPSLR